jgi:hypothetical protein
MCQPCLGKSKDAITAYVVGDQPVESLANIRITKGEMLRQETVEFFARNYTRLTGWAKFRKWFTDNTIGPEKYADTLAVDSFIKWVRREYNKGLVKKKEDKPQPAKKPAGMSAPLGEIAKVTIENPPKPTSGVVITEEEVDAAAKEAEAEPKATEKEKKSRRRKRGETQDAPAVPGVEAAISQKPTPKTESKRVKTDAEKLRDKIGKDKEKLRK